MSHLSIMKILIILFLTIISAFAEFDPTDLLPQSTSGEEFHKGGGSTADGHEVFSRSLKQLKKILANPKAAEKKYIEAKNKTIVTKCALSKLNTKAETAYIRGTKIKVMITEQLIEQIGEKNIRRGKHVLYEFWLMKDEKTNKLYLGVKGIFDPKTDKRKLLK